MHHSNFVRQFLFVAFFFLSSELAVGQVSIKEKISINPKASVQSTTSSIDFRLADAITVPYNASVSVQSTRYAPICPQDLKLGEQVVLRDLQLTPYASLGNFAAGSQLSFYAGSEGLR